MRACVETRACVLRPLDARQHNNTHMSRYSLLLLASILNHSLSPPRSAHYILPINQVLLMAERWQDETSDIIQYMATARHRVAQTMLYSFGRHVQAASKKESM